MYRRGSILLEFLIALSMMLMCLPILVNSMNSFQPLLNRNYEIQDLISANQIRKILLTSYDVTLEDNVIYFRHDGKDFKLSFINQYLVLQPGTQIYFPDIENAVFTYNNQILYLLYERNNKEYEISLYKE